MRKIFGFLLSVAVVLGGCVMGGEDGVGSGSGGQDSAVSSTTQALGTPVTVPIPLFYPRLIDDGPAPAQPIIQATQPNNGFSTQVVEFPASVAPVGSTISQVALRVKATGDSPGCFFVLYEQADDTIIGTYFSAATQTPITTTQTISLMPSFQPILVHSGHTFFVVYYIGGQAITGQCLLYSAELTYQ